MGSGFAILGREAAEEIERLRRQEHLELIRLMDRLNVGLKGLFENRVFGG